MTTQKGSDTHSAAYPPQLNCASCGKPNHPWRTLCAWCGKPTATAVVEKGLDDVRF